MKKILRRILSVRGYEILRNTKIYLLRFLMIGMRVFPINDLKVVACNFNGKGYGDNPKYVSEVLKDSNFNIIWLVKEYYENIPSYILQIKYGSLKAMYHLATAKIWIDNNRKDPYIVKRKNQYYIQMWHGSISLKKIEKDAVNVLNNNYIKNAQYDSTMIDLMISNSNFSDWLFSNSFWYNGEILKCGSPRLDILFNDNGEFKNKFCKEKGISKSSKFIMYAPTFRDTPNMHIYEFNQKKLLDVFNNKYKEDFYLLVRLHPNLKDLVKFNNENLNNVIDVSDYGDIYELMNICEFLITDYSSLMFEFPIAHRKGVFLYTQDMEKYNRGFYFDLNKLPFPISKSSEELIKCIEEFDNERFKCEVEKFYKKIGLIEDGNASIRVKEYICNLRD